MSRTRKGAKLSPKFYTPQWDTFGDGRLDPGKNSKIGHRRRERRVIARRELDAFCRELTIKLAGVDVYGEQR